MSDLRKWWGVRDGETVILVAKDEAGAAKLAGIRPSDLPFQFRVYSAALPLGVDRAGIYRNVGGAWWREQRPNGPPDLEDDQ